MRRVMDTLLAAAQRHVGEFTLAEAQWTAAAVAAALLTEAGNLYTGVSIGLACGIGFCAEHSAVAAMLQNRETFIKMIVATTNSRILPPCGRCRELMLQVDRRNLETEVILADGVVKLRDLLPHPWIPSSQ